MTAAAEVRPIDGALMSIPVGLIEPHPSNVRAALGDLHELAASIRARGILQPLLVERRPGGRYRLLAGHRRLAAAKLAQRSAVPCLLRRDDVADQLPMMLVENLQRADLTPLEQSRACAQLLGRGMSHGAIAAQVGKSTAWVADRLLLLELPPDAQHLVETRQVTVTEARGLARQVRASGRGTVKLGQTEQRCRHHFTRGHLLAGAARGLCDDADHPTARRLGTVACGACWEQAIRADTKGVAL